VLSWVKFRLEHLKKWREYAQSVAKASKALDPEAKVYVFGGVAENRMTSISDIDILIVWSKDLSDNKIMKLTNSD
jgi:predicted nucleotidyltransferase